MDTRNLHAFISSQTCASISCLDSNRTPYCFSCFYAYHEEKGLLIYKSSPEAHHSQLLNMLPEVAGTILPDQLSKLHIQGIQFEGYLLPENHPDSCHAATHYYKRHPLAMAHSGKLWIIRLQHIKYTDSKLGFGKKIEWMREEDVQMC
jgi:uncharacterized protein YhbP (UPF0306 family)